MRLFFLTTLVFASFSLFASQDENVQISTKPDDEKNSIAASTIKNKVNSDKKTPPSTPSTTNENSLEEGRTIAVFAGAPFPQNGITHLNTFGEFLWWTSGYDLSYAVVGSNTSTVNRQLLTFDSAYQPGLRIGLNYEFEKQGWDIALDWTCFHNEKSKTLVGLSEEIFLNWSSRYTDVTPPSTQFDIQHSSWKLHFNQVGLEMGNQLYFGKYFGFRPNTGFRYIHINNAFTVDYSSSVSPLTSNTSMKNSVHGFGFSFGFDNRFLLGAGIFLETNLKTGLVLSSTKVKYPGIINEIHDGFFGMIVRKYGNELIPILDGRIDLGWRRSFYNNQIALTLTGGYEYHVLINGFNAIASTNTTGAVVYPYQKTNLFVSGMNLGAKISY